MAALLESPVAVAMEPVMVAAAVGVETEAVVMVRAVADRVVASVAAPWVVAMAEGDLVEATEVEEVAAWLAGSVEVGMVAAMGVETMEARTAVVMVAVVMVEAVREAVREGGEAGSDWRAAVVAMMGDQNVEEEAALVDLAAA